MSNTFYLQDVDFSIKLKIEGNTSSLIFPQTRLMVNPTKFMKFLNENNGMVNKLLDCVMNGLEYLKSQGYSLPLHEGTNDLLDVIADLETQEVDWRFQHYVSPISKTLAKELTILFFGSLNQ